jgi:hypothetical protein
MLKIYDNIPVPSSDRKREPKYNFGLLQIGQAVFLEKKPDESDDKALIRVAATVQRHRKALGLDGWKFAVRNAAHPESSAPVIGVWRTA